MKEPLVIGIYGRSNTGKTTLIEYLIKKFTEQGYSVATIKKTEKSIGLDVKGKDTWRHHQAGAHMVVFCSKKESDFLIHTPLTTAEIVRHMTAIDVVDLIFVEGADDPSLLKIRVGNAPLRENTIGFYTNNKQDIMKLIQQRFATKSVEPHLQIIVNGKDLPLTAFPVKIIMQTVQGMLSSLKGAEHINEATIYLRNANKKREKNIKEFP